jgi:hypothetical protein
MLRCLRAIAINFSSFKSASHTKCTSWWWWFSHLLIHSTFDSRPFACMYRKYEILCYVARQIVWKIEWFFYEISCHRRVISLFIFIYVKKIVYTSLSCFMLTYNTYVIFSLAPIHTHTHMCGRKEWNQYLLNGNLIKCRFCFASEMRIIFVCVCVCFEIERQQKQLHSSRDSLCLKG